MSIDKIGKFGVLATLGAGAHSSILHIRREEDGREYALKVVNIETDAEKKFLEQAEHEFRVGQMLDHPNLVKVLAFETEKNWLFKVKKAKLLIEFVNGETLDKVKLMKRHRMLRVFEQVAAGMVHMHRRNVLHADLKPNNIMLGRGATVKVLDYGLAWIKGEPKDRVQGTPEYLAPETASHKLVNERTDMFNFGATMYRLVTFKLPPSVISNMPGVPMTERTYTSIYKPVNEIVATTPAPLCALIHKCMEFKANKRPDSFVEIQSTLAAMADDAERGLDPAELEA